MVSTFSPPVSPLPGNDGGQAFPMPAPGSRGMSLRDWFAGQALIGCLERMAEVQGLGSPTFPMNCAHHAYRIADAMLAERAKGGDA